VASAERSASEKKSGQIYAKQSAKLQSNAVVEQSFASASSVVAHLPV
jgi:hypothetical protein